MEAVERHGHEHGAEPVDGRERAVEHAGAVLVVSRVHHHEMVDGLNDEAEHAADHENPEQVEEVELDEAFARLVASQRAVLGALARLHVAQFALQRALFGERGV